MIGRKRDPDVSQSNLVSEKLEETGQLAVHGERHGFHLGGIRPHFVAENIVGRQADDQQIGGGAVAQFFVGDQLPRKFEFVIVGERRRAHQIIEIAVFRSGRLGGAQDFTVGSLSTPDSDTCLPACCR